MTAIPLKGVVFDLDGVITGTAKVHSLAWESMFNWYLKRLEERDGKPFQPFTSEDYLLYVDGKPRMQGVASFLESRGINLPYGTLEDGPDDETVCGLGNRKNADFQEVLKREGPEVFDTSVALIKELKARGIRVGVASSSRNCKLIMDLADIADLMETRVDGVVSHELGLNGKPDPDIFVTAAANLGLEPSECVVVEDAISGVQAGRAGNFGLTLGIAREISGLDLLRNGADIVITDLGEISADDLEAWFEHGVPEDGWNLSYSGFEPGSETLREALTAVGNGYMGVRGCFECDSASESHYPGTYIAGVYNKIPTPLHGRDIYNNDFVNCPNWLLVEFCVDDGPFESPLSMEVLGYTQNLDMLGGVMERSMVVRDKLGRVTRIRTSRLASMAKPHLCGLSFELTPVNYFGAITFRSSIDGDIINDNVPRYRQLDQQHLAPASQGASGEGVYLEVKTTASDYRIVMNGRTDVYLGGKKADIACDIIEAEAFIGQEFTVDANEGEVIRLEKLVSVYTSLDQGVDDPIGAAAEATAGIRNYKSLLAPHLKAWAKLWDMGNVAVEGDRLAQKLIRLHSYHLLVTSSPHNKSIDAGMPARGLHGEAYRGHVFWDELYIMPFFDLRFPEISKALLMYRYNRLDGAREYARENGYDGAMYPWQTADGGEEETQEVHYNPKSDDWGPDLSRRQRHVSIAIFFNVWRYVHCTGDSKFMREQGAEMMISIARFWASIAEKGDDGKFHIPGVMGPDEFHEKLPDSDEPGITDNAYTNVMVSWLMEKAIELVQKMKSGDLDPVFERSGFVPSELGLWRDIADNLEVIVTNDGIISQFDGYMELAELDWDGYRDKYGDIHRLDRILKAEGDSPDKYKLAKQADTLMMFYVLAPEEVCTILKRLGVEPGNALELLKKNYDFYEGRTSHGSTLSKVVHAVISSYFPGSDTAWEWFMEALVSDWQDTQGGTTPEGIHTGVMAGTIDVVTRYFAGVNATGDHLVIQPHLPEHWKNLRLSVKFRKVVYRLEYTHESVTVTAEGRGKPRVELLGQDYELESGTPLKVDM